MQLHQFFRFMIMQGSPIELFSDTLKSIHKQWDEIKNVHLFHLKCTYYFKNYRRFHCSWGSKKIILYYYGAHTHAHKEKEGIHFFSHKCLMCTDMIRLTATSSNERTKKNLTKNLKYSSGAAKVEAVSK